MNTDKCFCHLNGYAVKDATARQAIAEMQETINTLQETITALEATVAELAASSGGSLAAQASMTYQSTPEVHTGSFSPVAL